MADRHNVAITPEIEARFWAKVERLGPDDCWPWQAAINSSGYGSFGIGCATFYSSQVALMVAGFPRPRPPNDHALHSCDNRACTNPAHLRWGTHQENMKDRGERCVGFNKDRKGYSILTEEQALHVLHSAETGNALAKKFGVHKGTISDVRCRKTWRHLAP